MLCRDRWRAGSYLEAGRRAGGTATRWDPCAVAAAGWEPARPERPRREAREPASLASSDGGGTPFLNRGDVVYFSALVNPVQTDWLI